MCINIFRFCSIIKIKTRQNLVFLHLYLPVIRSFRDLISRSLRKFPKCMSLLTLKSLPYCFSMVPIWVSSRLSRNLPSSLRERHPFIPGASFLHFITLRLSRPNGLIEKVRPRSFLSLIATSLQSHATRAVQYKIRELPRLYFILVLDLN